MTREEIEAVLDDPTMEYGPAHVARLDEAVRAADALKDDEFAFEVRTALIEASFFGGAPEKGVVAFAWCVAKSDAEPERFPERNPGMGTDLLWMHKWIAGYLHCYPQLTRVQIEAALDDMEKRYTRQGLSLRPVDSLRMHAVLEMDGDADLARKLYRKAQWAKRDLYADCAACEDHSAVELHVKTGQYDRAMEIAQGLLSGSRRPCAEVPHKTYALLLGAARALGDAKEAERLHQVGLPMVDSNPDFVRDLAYHLDHLVHTGQRDSARAIVPKQIEWALKTHDLDARMWSFASVRFFLEAEQGPMDLRLPKSLRATLGEAPDAATLRDYFEQQSAALAARFDARNGNDVVSRRLAAHPG